MPTSEDPAALLLIAHGTRDPGGATEMAALLDLVRERLPGVAVAAGWLEDFAEPDAVTAAGRLLDGGPRELVVLPLLHFAAGHATYDVPREVAAVREAWPDVTVYHGEVLGVHPALVAAAAQRVAAQGEGADVLVVAASGSTDAEANGDLAKAARMLAEATGHRWVEVCFAAVTWPRIDEVLTRVTAAGARRAVLFSWSLLAGVLEQRVRAAAAAVPGVEMRLAGRFGPDPAVAEVVADRYAGAVQAGSRPKRASSCEQRSSKSPGTSGAITSNSR